MSLGDKTGPLGLGPRSGGRRGRCSGAETPEAWSGSGLGRSWGRNCRRAPLDDAADETTRLNGKLTELEKSLAAIKAIIANLGKK
jgi:hypothetical protein